MQYLWEADMARRIRYGSANGRRVGFATVEGGVAELHIDKTGAPSVGGQVVVYGSLNDSVDVSGTEEFQPIGVIYSAPWNVGVADGDEVAVITGGEADVLLEDGTGASVNNWAKTSDTQAGRADATNTEPPGGAIILELNEHMRELGHVSQTVYGASGESVTSITRSGSTATVTTPSAHNLTTNRQIRVSGANEAEYNGDFMITVTDTDEFTYEVGGTPATPATGTITYDTINTLCRIHLHPN